MWIESMTDDNSLIKGEFYRVKRYYSGSYPVFDIENNRGYPMGRYKLSNFKIDDDLSEYLQILKGESRSNWIDFEKEVDPGTTKWVRCVKNHKLVRLGRIYEIESFSEDYFRISGIDYDFPLHWGPSYFLHADTSDVRQSKLDDIKEIENPLPKLDSRFEIIKKLLAVISNRKRHSIDIVDWFKKMNSDRDLSNLDEILDLSLRDILKIYHKNEDL